MTEDRVNMRLFKMEPTKNLHEYMIFGKESQHATKYNLYLIILPSKFIYQNFENVE